jgi:hypothetical protein
MPDFMIQGILLALMIAWKIRDNELREARPQLHPEPLMSGLNHPPRTCLTEATAQGAA